MVSFKSLDPKIFLVIILKGLWNLGGLRNWRSDVNRPIPSFQLKRISSWSMPKTRLGQETR